MKLPILMRGLFVLFAVFVFVRGEFGTIAGSIAAALTTPLAAIVIVISLIAFLVPKEKLYES